MLIFDTERLQPEGLFRALVRWPGATNSSASLNKGDPPRGFLAESPVA